MIIVARLVVEEDLPYEFFDVSRRPSRMALLSCSTASSWKAIIALRGDGAGTLPLVRVFASARQV